MSARPPPVAGLIAFDLLFWGLFTVLVAGAALPVAALWSWLPVPMPWALGLLVPLIPLFLLGLFLEVALLRRLAPRLRPGRYPFPFSPMALTWQWSLLLHRVLFHPWWSALVLGSTTLRFLALRALGGRVAFRSMMSSDVLHVDPGLLTVDPGALIGSQVLTGGHLIQGGHLLLAPIHVGAGAEIHVGSRIGPGTRIGPRAQIGVESILAHAIEVGEGAVTGLGCLLRAHVTLGPGARLGDGCILEKGVRIGAGATVAPGTTVPSGTEVPEGATFPYPES